MTVAVTTPLAPGLYLVKWTTGRDGQGRCAGGVRVHRGGVLALAGQPQPDRLDRRLAQRERLAVRVADRFAVGQSRTQPVR